jgi:hypothetical protein
MIRDAERFVLSYRQTIEKAARELEPHVEAKELA